MKRAAAICAKNHDLVPFRRRNAQDPPHTLLMELPQLPLPNLDVSRSIPVIHLIARTLPEIGRRAGQHIDRVPFLWRQSLRDGSIRFEYHHARGVDTIIIMKRIF